MGYGFKIMVEGDMACFTRPEMKVERVSYDVPTPSALVGLIKSVYWKPAIEIVIDKIIVFSPINFANIRRNEVKDKVKLSLVKNQMNGGGANPEIITKEVISQRATMLLTNVRYGVEFHFEMTGLRSTHEDESPEKHYNIMLRRLKNGQHFRTPCLGCSEMFAKKITLVDEFDLSQIAPEIKNQDDVDLGYMLYSLSFKDKGKDEGKNWEDIIFSDAADAVYYRPHMQNGVIDVAKYRKELKC